MKITYDESVDVLNISLRSGRVAHTLEVAPEIMVDVDKSGNTLSLEIVGASEKIGRKNFTSVTIGGKAIPLAVA